MNATAVIEQQLSLSNEKPFEISVQRSPYLVSPLIDGFLVCGGLPLILGLLVCYYPVEKFAASRWLLGPMFIQVIGFVFANPHTAATWMRIYSTRESRARFSLHTKWLLLPTFALIGLGLLYSSVAAVMAKIYVLWVVQHYTWQAYGLAMIYCGRNGYVMSPRMRLWFKRVILTLTLWRISAQLSVGQSALFIMPIPIWDVLPYWTVLALRGLFLCSLAVFSGVIAEEFVRDRKFPPWTFLLLTVSIALFMGMDGRLGASFWIFVPAFFHGSQYLLISGYYFMREKGARNRPLVTKHVLAYVITVCALGYLAYESIPAILTLAGFEYALAAVFGPINFHHFLTDRAIWKLRDPRTRRVVIGPT